MRRGLLARPPATNRPAGGAWIILSGLLYRVAMVRRPACACPTAGRYGQKTAGLPRHAPQRTLAGTRRRCLFAGSLSGRGRRATSARCDPATRRCAKAPRQMMWPPRPPCAPPLVPGRRDRGRRLLGLAETDVPRLGRAASAAGSPRDGAGAGLRPGARALRRGVDRLCGLSASGRVQAVPSRSTDTAADTARNMLDMALDSRDGFTDMLVTT